METPESAGDTGGPYALGMALGAWSHIARAERRAISTSCAVLVRRPWCRKALRRPSAGAIGSMISIEGRGPGAPSGRAPAPP
jgi:hypothetical protein